MVTVLLFDSAQTIRCSSSSRHMRSQARRHWLVQCMGIESVEINRNHVLTTRLPVQLKQLPVSVPAMSTSALKPAATHAEHTMRASKYTAAQAVLRDRRLGSVWAALTDMSAYLGGPARLMRVSRSSR